MCAFVAKGKGGERGVPPPCVGRKVGRGCCRERKRARGSAGAGARCERPNPSLDKATVVMLSLWMLTFCLLPFTRSSRPSAQPPLPPSRPPRCTLGLLMWCTSRDGSCSPSKSRSNRSRPSTPATSSDSRLVSTELRRRSSLPRGPREWGGSRRPSRSPSAARLDEGSEGDAPRTLALRRSLGGLPLPHVERPELSRERPSTAAFSGSLEARSVFE